MAANTFQVFVSGATSSVEDWGNAMGAPDSELPELDEEQKAMARKFDLDDNEYARGVLVQKFGETREQKRGERLGRFIGEILHGLGPGYVLNALMLKPMEDFWVARIQMPQRVAMIRIPRGVANCVLDTNEAEIESLKEAILQGLDLFDARAAS